MSVVKKTSEYTIIKRRNGRYAVIGVNKKPINGDEKTKILIAEDLIKVKLPEPPPAAEEAAADEGGEKSEEAAE